MAGAGICQTDGGVKHHRHAVSRPALWTRLGKAVSKNVASGCQPGEAGAQEAKRGQINFVLSNAGLSVPEFNFVNFIQVYSLLGLP